MNIDISLNVVVELGQTTQAFLMQAAALKEAAERPASDYGQGYAEAGPNTYAPETAQDTAQEAQETAPATEAPKARRGRKPKAGANGAAEKAISTTPEDRKPPEDEPEPDQSEADQGEEDGDDAVTHETVRTVLTRYGEMYGMTAAMEDGPKALEMRFGKGVTKISQIPENAEALAQAVADINEMIERNPFKRSSQVL